MQLPGVLPYTLNLASPVRCTSFGDWRQHRRHVSGMLRACRVVMSLLYCSISNIIIVIYNNNTNKNNNNSNNNNNNNSNSNSNNNNSNDNNNNNNNNNRSYMHLHLALLAFCLRGSLCSPRTWIAGLAAWVQCITSPSRGVGSCSIIYFTILYNIM